MPILSAIGLGILIIMLKMLVPAIFAQLSSTIIAFLHGAQVSADVASTRRICSICKIPDPLTERTLPGPFCIYI